MNMWDSGYTHSPVTVFIPRVPFHAHAHVKVFSFEPQVLPTSNRLVELCEYSWITELQVILPNEFKIL